MDSIDFDSVKAEKAKALRRFNRFRRIGRFFRAAEICLALLFLCWSFTCLPFVVRISGEFLRRIAAVISTPLFVFILGNAIVVVLYAKSSDDQITGDSSSAVYAGSAENEIYDAFVRSVENRSKPSDETEEIVYDDKQVIVTDLNSISNSNSNSNIPHVEIEIDHNYPKVYRRSKSDVVSAKQSPDIVVKRSLQRSETEKKCREIVDDDDDYAEDNLSNEEFQRKIDAFIAKHQLFRRKESLAVVVHNKSLI